MLQSKMLKWIWPTNCFEFNRPTLHQVER